ncbi:hypothetical protein BO71DRAFT_55850 [Aspergillus ellipticus CBS 707.79]|uniref:Uncharacterized protein n=1 Tax=Aspergillus ellipticus CBS 707.79 TaxID=1448320 RepID=A0A319D2C8_9EURO|nr:hypothetical protein BO71DRAFT_55850 [Aspergillus ellipticus CBS 707.79]
MLKRVRYPVRRCRLQTAWCRVQHRQRVLLSGWLTGWLAVYLSVCMLCLVGPTGRWHEMRWVSFRVQITTLRGRWGGWVGDENNNKKKIKTLA